MSPTLAEESIERDAAALLAEFEHARGVKLELPIPIEDIVEKYLKLRIEFDDMHARHNVPRPASGETDILGAIYGDGSIFIDESLDPEESPVRESRYRFTLAHEGGGHWRLHQDLIVQDTAQISFLDAAGQPKFICRSSEAKERVVWQADFYASCLLMPRKMIFAVWDEFFPDRKQRVLQPEMPIAHGEPPGSPHRFRKMPIRESPRESPLQRLGIRGDGAVKPSANIKYLHEFCQTLAGSEQHEVRASVDALGSDCGRTSIRQMIETIRQRTCVGPARAWRHSE